jgi:hypothetical protein
MIPRQEDVAVDYQTLLDRRAEIAEEITQTIGRLGVLVRQDIELQDQLRRAAERAGSRANAFSTTPTVMDAINSELTRAGLRAYPCRSERRWKSIDFPSFSEKIAATGIGS